MVKHPRYQAMDNARQDEIPRAFEEHSTDEFYLKRIEPVIPKVPRPGPIPRPHFRAYNSDDELVAVFYPNGIFECHKEGFREIYDRIVQDAEQAAEKALKEYEKVNQ